MDTVNQKHYHSLLETIVGTTVGFAGSYLLGLLIIPILVGPVTHEANFILVLVYTIWSVVRGYYNRRFFNLLHMKGILK